MRTVVVLLGMWLAVTSCSGADSSPGAAMGGRSGASGAGGATQSSTSTAAGSGGPLTSAGSGGDAKAGTGGSGGAGGTGGDAATTTGGGSDTKDGGESGSGGAPLDAGSDASGGGAGGGAPGTVQCGNAMPDVSGFTAQESLVVGPDGTIYSCSRVAVLGRFVPPYTHPENAWLTIPNAKVFGIALDPKRKVLYAGARGTNRVYRIPTDAPTTMDTLAPTMGSPEGINGVTLGDDGAFYYGDQVGGHVYRLNPDDQTTIQVTKTPVTGANGLAFAPAPDGRLWVLSYSQPGAVTRFKVDAAHAEIAGTRDSFKLPGNNADGIAFDQAGTAYITAGGLYRVTPDGQATRISASGGANVEFGAGALSCKLILWAGNPVHTMLNDVEGAIVPWHRL
jgi:hypothetical protein